MIRFTGTSSAFDSALAESPIVSSSSRRISPGCTGLIPFLAFIVVPPSVMVHDLHVARPFHGPTEADEPLYVDPNAVLTGAIAP